MGLLIDGVWHDQWYDTKKTGGAFERTKTQFRDQVTANSNDKFPAEAGRYHLYVSPACPWSHRTIILRKLKGLEDIISMSKVSPHMLTHGWELNGKFDSDTDEINHCQFMHQIYTLAKSNYSGRVTVPTLWDKKTSTIVSNESAEIVNMFNSSFNEITGNLTDYCPAALCNEQDSINTLVYHNINNGVYRCGFATSQAVYDQAFDDLFEALDKSETRLSSQRYLMGGQITMADWRLFVTLVRFDAVYYSHFKCNRQRIEDYPNLSNYLRDIYQQPGVEETVNMTHIKQHYYYSHDTINPTRIIPRGPALNFNAPHDRTRFDKD